MPTVFISYSHADSKFVNDLANKLKSSGVDVWIDKWKIKVGDSITGKINEGIGASDFLIVVLSHTSVESKWVKEEINTALIRNIEQDKLAFILPILKEDCELPPIFQHRRYANFKDDQERGFQELLEIILPYMGSEPEMILIHAGDFIMGSDPKTDKDARYEEQPPHHVSVPEFYIGKYPITNIQYKAFLDATRHSRPDDQRNPEVPDYYLYGEKKDHPVVGASWNDARAFCLWLTKFSGKPYRLPTEAEWEKAARGTDGRIYPWGNEWDETKCYSGERDIGETTPVGQYSPQGDSPYGCADMAGNVWEWCADWYGENEYRRRKGATVKDPQGPKNGILRVVRGGAYYSNPRGVRCAFRRYLRPGYRLKYLGFRVAVSLPTSDI